jgi:hypothetical protein
MNELVLQLKEAEQDFEWYPTTDRMISVVKAHLPENASSILDIGAGDARTLVSFEQKCRDAKLYSIELSSILVQQQPANIIPVGTNLFEQRLASLQTDYIFCNPPYSEYEEWVCKIIDEGYAKRAFVVIPSRWNQSKSIQAAIKRRGATTRTIFEGDFSNAERQARAIIEIVKITFPRDEHRYEKVKDPFDIWFDANVGTFDQQEEPVSKYQAGENLAKRMFDASIDDMVRAYDAEYEILIRNYQAIFQLDYAVLHELGINKDAVREGLKMKMTGLKVLYWQVLFDRLEAITSRLTTKSKASILEKMTNNTAINFTVSNCYSVVIWAIKNANEYFDKQAIQLFYDLATEEGIENYKSNQKTWKKDGWRYGRDETHTHYKLDYRIVLNGSNYAIRPKGAYEWDYPGNLHKGRHDMIADIKAVLSNLGFTTSPPSSKNRQWVGGQWQDFYEDNSDDVLFQVKGYMNGNLHLRFMPEAIMALNVYVARSLKWVRSEKDVIEEMEIPVDEAIKYFNHNPYITMDKVGLLNAPK